MKNRWTQAELREATLWWVASLTVGGRAYRWAESPLAINSDGGLLSVAGGLQGAQVDCQAPWMGLTPEARKASLDLAPGAAKPADLISGRYSLDGAPAEVALLREGDDWEDRQVILRGYVVGYDWGGDDEILSISAEETADQDRGLLPDPGALVSATTWPYASENAVGMWYIMVYGTPGSSGVPAVPALFVASTTVGGISDWLLVAGHPVVATSCVVYDGTNSETLNILTVADGAGRLVSVVDLATATTIAVDPSLDYQTGWTSAGALSVSGSDPGGAGSILETVLTSSTLPIDRGILASSRDALNAFRIGAFIQEPISPMDWITQALLPLLPISVTTGPNGWRVSPIPMTPKSLDCIATITAGDGYTQAVRIDRAQRVGFDTIANEIALKYALDVSSNASSATATISGSGYDGVAHTDLQSRLSQQTYGKRVKSLETVAVYDDSTAYRIVRWQAIAYGFTRTQVRYSLVQSYAFLMAGDLVWLTDSRIKIDSPAWVQRASLQSDGHIEVELIIWEVPRG